MDADRTTCAACGRLIHEDSPSGDPGARQLCPACGSTSRVFSASASAALQASASATATVLTYPAALVGVARDLISNGQPTVSVVVSHMACEVAAERALSAAFKARAAADLEEVVMGFMNGFNLANDRNRKLYVALTGDAIASKPFWAEFKESATRRNKIVHQGLIVSPVEAEASYRAAVSLIAHLKQ